MPALSPNPKKAPVAKPIMEELKAKGGEYKKTFLKWAGNLDKFRNIVKSNFDLGCKHLYMGNLRDAELRFKFVVWLDANHADGWYFLGNTYLIQDKKRQARDAFAKAVKLKPKNEEALYMLALASGKGMTAANMPKRTPPSLIGGQFDVLAPTYAQDQLEMLHYEGHRELCNSIRACAVTGRIDHSILELGPGTGFCGPLVRDIAFQITGVDISQEMLNRAMKLEDSRGRKIYDSLIKRDLHVFLKEADPIAYDIVMAANVFCYVGDLEMVFGQVPRVLRDGGLFAFTADKAADGVNGYSFDSETGRFSFTDIYLKDLAERNKLKEVRFRDEEIYADTRAWVCVFRK